MGFQRFVGAVAVLVAMVSQPAVGHYSDPGPETRITTAGLHNFADAYAQNSLKTQTGGEGWQKRFQKGEVPRMNLKHKGYIPAELSTVPDKMNLGTVKQVRAAGNKFLEQAIKFEQKQIEKEKKNTVFGANRQAFQGKWTDAADLPPAVNAKLKATKGWEKIKQHYNAGAVSTIHEYKNWAKPSEARPLALGRKGGKPTKK
mmetsp:Transcript_20274/g.24223  ORF Transcript_20274/g.24223 Transcript_20274/m.24223 type:complete len:201 (-) Transcript_20274:487-1089(-)|eukprot:CAMPEP_0197846796 /NCGR_PEP_ID=MMETSP1438-20131217/4385_1 /TAXON_ID=1461541 /ORGANISM="Pterosperma sp., Strain CCMP1384" /LENGTH=200 /DNA_ID=CAMNT_0043458559 /DNA_START=112 /DNA_END=714 /DNA_ORIENTATION=+